MKKSEKIFRCNHVLSLPQYNRSGYATCIVDVPKNSLWTLLRKGLYNELRITGYCCKEFIIELSENHFEKFFEEISSEEISDLDILFQSSVDYADRFTEWNKEHTHGCGLPGKDCFTKLAKYEDMEEQGTLIKLPVEIGGKLYRFSSCFGRVLEYTFYGIIIDNNSVLLQTAAYSESCGDCPSECLDEIDESIEEIGKTIFLTYEEALPEDVPERDFIGRLFECTRVISSPLWDEKSDSLSTKSVMIERGSIWGCTGEGHFMDLRLENSENGSVIELYEETLEMFFRDVTEEKERA